MTTTPDDVVEIPIRFEGGRPVPGRNGGHVRVRGNTTIRWTADREFSIDLALLPLENGYATGASPFGGAAGCQAAPDGTGYACSVTVPDIPGERVPPVYEYSIRAGSGQADPIIIVDR